MTETPQPETKIKALEDLTLSELRKEAVSAGLIGAELFETKKPLIAAINSLRAQAKVSKFEATPVPGIDNPSQDIRQYTSKRDRMKANLAAQPKVRFFIPLDRGEKSGAIETVILNGYRLNIAKGQFVDLPKQVADVLAESYNLTVEAGKEYDINRIDPKTGKPVSDQL